ncbi:DoxX family protein [Lacihabitans sp. LS3-19]|uniref:DoxX family protein n=1 Tax=Lacihabitans sp. LS3-19 TaxID=2487335 RepID=UPI0020CDB322|nr:DoxX family protein [Lacihabitans sp. LS3-19]MCP9768516.1 DoxX family protein [Lacihabitans sp. LS3-19]
MLKRRFNIPISIDFAILILRVFPSMFMMTHGWSKLMRIISGDMSFGDPIGIGETTSLFLTVFAEFFCSIMVIFGFLTRPALIALMFTMSVAAFIVHGSDPFDVKEHALLFLAIYAAIFVTGPGRISVDNRIFNS